MSDTNTDPNSPQMAFCQQEPCSLSSECVLTRDLKGRLGIQSAPEVFLCARASIEDLITRHNELIRERDDARQATRQWCDKARKAEAALDALEDLTRELAATKKTLGTLIAWSVLELGEQNTQRLLDMMSAENAGGMAAGADGPPMPSERKA